MKVNWTSWIKFLRLPGVLTVPGDVWVGAAVAGGEASWRTVGAVGAAYLFGMALNDVMDVREDRVERPDRPLASGAIPLRQGRVACAVLGGCAFIGLPGMPMGLLLGLIVLYTVLKSVHLWPGAFLMAGCRGAALWIGAGAPEKLSIPLMSVIGFWMCLIVGITLLADRENDPAKPGNGLSALLCAIWFAGAVGIVLWAGPPFWTVVPLLILAGTLWQNHQSIRQQQRVRPRNIGVLLSLLIPLQSLLLMAFAEPLAGAGVLLIWPLLRVTARRVAMS